ncbi:MAG: TCR/Tet family MFS transporter [Planctomycetes bacterium]|nr:TCR/Tet family MFS transporter [Planctomycetota bacterium]
MLVDVLGFGLLIPIAPRLVQQLQGGSEGDAAHIVGYLMAIYALMSFVFAPIWGSLSDSFGRRPIILLALLGSGIDYLAQALAPSLTFLFITRAINGISGASFSVAGAYIADVTPPERRAAGFGLIGAAFGLGFIIGPLIGGFLGKIDIRYPFYAAAALTLLNWLYGYFVLPESLAPQNKRPFSWKRANPIGTLSILLRAPLVTGLAAAMILINFAHFGLQSVWVLYTAHRYQWDEVQTAASLSTVGVTTAIVQGLLARKLIPVLGETRSLLFGLVIAIFAYIGYGLATHGWMIYTIIVCASISGIASPALQGILSKSIPANEQGGLQGGLNSLSSLVQIGAPITATTLFAFFISAKAPIALPGAPFLLSSVLCIVALVLAIFLFRKYPLSTTQAPAEIEADVPATAEPASAPAGK